VASDSSDNGTPSKDGGEAQASHERRECMACRGSGQVISNLGASPSTVTCPWCQGQGVRVPGIDAQAHWAQAQSEPGSTSPAAELET
jgi:DnaJ-class molecular chaperone